MTVCTRSEALSYPYAGRDLFARPESYFYAACAEPGYLAAWRDSREAFRRDLRGAAGRPQDEPAPPQGAVALADVLARAAAQGAQAEAAAIAPFVTRYEVFKRLFAWYGADGRRHPESPPASRAAYVTLAEALARQARAGSLKHLSALLKLADALASLPAAGYAPEEAARLEAVLAEEADLVADLERAA